MAAKRNSYTQARQSPSPIRNSPPKLVNWVPTSLHFGFLLAFFFFVVGCIGALEGLHRISVKNQGLKTINTQRLSDYLNQLSLNSSIRSIFAGLDQGAFFYGYIVTFVASVVNLLWSSVVADLLTRQPFIELAKNGGPSAKYTISLDYASNLLPVRVWKLARFRHFYCLLAIFIGCITNFVITPLSSSLFVSLPSTISETISVKQTSVFKGDVDFSQVNVLNSINLATSILAYNTTPPPWSSADFAFDHFAVSDSTQIDANSVVSGVVNAYSGTLSCQALGSPVLSNVNNGFKYSGIDRGCEVSSLVDNLLSGLFVHVRAQSCSSQSGTLAATTATQRRLVFTVTMEQGTATPINTTIISCIPYYAVSSASVMVNPFNSQLIGYILLDDGKDFQSNFSSAAQFEQQLELIFTTDPSAKQSLDAYGTYLTQVIQSGHQSIFDASALVAVLPKTFSALFSQMTLSLLTTTASKSPFNGVSEKKVLRLCTFNTIVRLLQGFLGLIALTILTSIFYPLIYQVKVRASGQSILERGLLLHDSNFLDDPRLLGGGSSMKSFEEDDATKYLLVNGAVHVQSRGAVVFT